MKRSDHIRESRSLTPDKILGKIAEGKKRLIELRQEKLLGKLKNTAQIRQIKKQVARLNTILDEKVTAKVNDK